MRLRIWLAAAATVGFCASASAQTAVPAGVIAGAETWCDDEAYMVLEGAVIVTGTLTINAGCIVRGQPRNDDFVIFPDPNEPGSLQIARGGFLDAQGTVTDPIIFTTAAVDTNDDGIPEPDPVGTGLLDWDLATHGDDNFYDDTPRTNPLAPLRVDGGQNTALWGGVIMVGFAPTNVDDGINPVGTGELEGTDGLLYGCEVTAPEPNNCDPLDDSGILTFASIRHGGDIIAEANEINGLTLGGVGSGTTLENIEVYANNDDGIEYFGGTANARNLLFAFIGDDSTDTDQGYSGTNQNVLILDTFFNEDGGLPYGAESGDSGGEWDGDDHAPSAATPRTDAIFCNVTFMGNQVDGAGANPAVSPAPANEAFEPDTAFGGALVNSIVVNSLGATPFDLNGGGRPPVSCSPGAPNDGERVAGATAFVFEDDEELICVANTFTDTNVNSNQCDDECFRNGDALAATLVGVGDNFVAYSDSVWDAALDGPDPANTFELLVNENTWFEPKGVVSNGRGKLATAKAVAADPRPASPADANVTGGIDPTDVGCPDAAATYRGAAPAGSPLFTDGWTAMSAGGILPLPEPGNLTMLASGALTLFGLARRRARRA